MASRRSSAPTRRRAFPSSAAMSSNPTARLGSRLRSSSSVGSSTMAERCARIKLGVIGVAPPQIAQWDEAHVRGRLTTVDMVEAARARGWRTQGPTSISSSRSATPAFRVCASAHRRGERGAGPRHAGRRRRAVSRPSALAVSRRGFCRRRPAPTPSAERSTASRRSWPGSGAAISASSTLSWSVGRRPMAGCAGARRGPADRQARRQWRRDRARRVGRFGARRGQSRACRDARLCAHAGRRARDAAAHLSGADRRRSDSRARQRGPARLRQRRSPRRAPTSLRCRFSRPRRHSNAAGAAGRTFIPTSPRVRSRSRTWPTSIPIPNSVRVVKVDGATLREWLERSASIFRRIDPRSRDEQPLLGPAFASYNFDVIDGVEYAIDVTAARPIRRIGRAGRAAGAPYPGSCLQRRARRSGTGVSRRHQQLSRQRRRRLPRLRRNDRGDRGARRQPRRRPQVH